MEIKDIKNIATEWHQITWEVIEFKNIDLTKIQKVFEDTYTLLKKYKFEKLVPKELSAVLLEMLDFCWWVCDLEESSIHYLYKDITTLVANLNKYFLTHDTDTTTVEEIIIDKLNQISRS